MNTVASRNISGRPAVISNMKNYEFGIDTFGDVTQDKNTGELVSHAQAVRNVAKLGQAADEVGLDVIAIGEHHRDDFAISAPEMVLASIAATTQNIKLSTAVTVLSSEDPVRVYERFSTLDALSSGRAEIILGRGSFTESFPLFGYDLGDYESLFEEKLELFAKLRTEQPLTWKGNHTQDLNDVTLYPPMEDGRTLPAWVAVGGSPQSVIRAAHYDLPLMLAIIGGPSARFAPFANLYREAREKFGHEGPAQVGYHFVGHVADTDEQAFEEFAEHHLASHRRIGAERGWGGMTPMMLKNELAHGAAGVGSPETVARKIVQGLTDLGAQRASMKTIHGPIPHEYNLDSVRLFGEKVVPLVKDMLTDQD